MPREWTEEDKQKVVDYYTKDKYGIKKIAEIFKCRTDIISNILTEKNVQKRRGKKDTYSTKKKNKKL